MHKKDHIIFKKIFEIFIIYNNYKFKINNRVIFENSQLKIEPKNYKIITSFVKLVDKAMETLPEDEYKVVEIEFIKLLGYEHYTLSQSTFFSKRRKACRKLYNILFCGTSSKDIEKAFNLWKLN